MLAEVAFSLSQCMHLTERQADVHHNTMAAQLQRGKNDII